MVSPETSNCTVAVVGLGYIGLPTAVSLATGGLDVVGVDISPGIVELVNRGEAPFAEPDLSVGVSGAVAMGRLTAQREMPQSGAYIIAVPTPFDGDHRPDLGAVTAAARSVAPVLRGGEVIVLESTVPPGTTRAISELIAGLRPDLRLPHASEEPDVHLAHCPERVLPGRIMIEIATNDRVIGGLTPACARRAAELYRTFCHGELIITDAASAEMAKLAENAYRDVNIAFANELSLICDRLGLDVWEIRQMANHHPRVDILRPGPGVGGHCIAVDPWFIVAAAPEQATLIAAARHINDQMPAHTAERIVATSRRFREPRIVCLGLSFKADVGDLRGSPAVEIVARVAAALPEVKVLAVEPHATALPDQLDSLGNVILADTAPDIPLGIEHAIADADVIALLTDHGCFRSIRRSQLAGKVVYDTRGMWA
ncbi:MAG TPA: UDP-N-acetyl-D-mannosamine dehydrogenase [Streptosporangiaceae bacterium]|nr:UDP-N-acetyl-D-mannosamine dehydrogenase [Streptosporangiaceae bacterium]